MDHDVYLDAIKRGDAPAFGQWAARVEFRLRASLRRFALQVDVEAVLQEALLRVWQVAPKVTPDGRPDALLRFAIRVCRNTAISELRRLGTRADIETALEEEQSAAIEPDPLLREIIARCRQELPPKPAQALALRLVEVANDRVLAAQANMRPNTFLQNVARARRLLVACLERHGIQLETVMR